MKSKETVPFFELIKIVFAITSVGAQLFLICHVFERLDAKV